MPRNRPEMLPKSRLFLYMAAHQSRKPPSLSNEAGTCLVAQESDGLASRTTVSIVLIAIALFLPAPSRSTYGPWDQILSTSSAVFQPPPYLTRLPIFTQPDPIS